jgi:hypothetical protein
VDEAFHQKSSRKNRKSLFSKRAFLMKKFVESFEKLPKSYSKKARHKSPQES